MQILLNSDDCKLNILISILITMKIEIFVVVLAAVSAFAADQTNEEAHIEALLITVRRIRILILSFRVLTYISLKCGGHTKTVA